MISTLLCTDSLKRAAAFYGHALAFPQIRRKGAQITPGEFCGPTSAAEDKAVLAGDAWPVMLPPSGFSPFR